MRIPSTDGVELAVHDLGGDGPPLLLAHATGLLARMYEPLTDVLGERLHVWGVDLRAHGDSTRPASGDLAWHGMAADVAAAIAALGLDRPFGFGHSMGGAALTLAELERPGTFRALYLFEPVLVPAGAFGAVEDDNPMSSAARRRRAVFDSRDAAYENYTDKPPMNELTPAALRAYVDHGFAERPDGAVELKCRPEDEAETFRLAGRDDAYERLHEVRCPVSVARGSVDSPGPGRFASAQSERFAVGRLLVLDGVGHFGPMQDPALVARSIFESLLGG